MFGVTATVLAATAAGHVPGVQRAAVAVLTGDVGQTEALTAAAMAVTVTGRRTAGGIAPHLVTDALAAVLLQGVAIVTQLAVLAGGALAVVQAEQALASSAVTGPRVQHVDVVVALTRLTMASHLVWVSVVTR